MSRVNSMSELEERLAHLKQYDLFLKGEWSKQWTRWRHSYHPLTYASKLMHEGFFSADSRRLILRASLPFVGGALFRIWLPKTGAARIWHGLSFALQQLLVDRLAKNAE